ncbi:exopolysaccharide biosynthesis protein [Martelella alba]|uniref:Exopolysaccharide biosynthesis protein n=1 Tax=Martelella alba TaxID=2590451 RepID=A0A506UJR1_9HYPH|nr:exopolysaccharide biosynthesis protein [Martelella alba]TPW33571.1 exopolysaccharide biosynthesis protein [Martelella alba]
MNEAADQTSRNSEHSGIERFSDLLESIKPDAQGRVSLRQFDESLAERSFGTFLVLFSLPNLVPMPPGATLILGLPLIFVAWQMLASRRNSIWLPESLARLSLDGTRYEVLIGRLLPGLRWLEQAVRPRAWIYASRRAERLLGAFCLLLSIVVFIPIPFGNWLPALALAVIGLSVSERDGLGILAGIVIGTISIMVAVLVIFAAGALLAMLF